MSAKLQSKKSRAKLVPMAKETKLLPASAVASAKARPGRRLRVDQPELTQTGHDQPLLEVGSPDAFIIALVATPVCPSVEPSAQAPAEEKGSSANGQPGRATGKKKIRSPHASRLHQEYAEGLIKRMLTIPMPKQLRALVESVIRDEIVFVDNPIFAETDPAILSDILGPAPESDVRPRKRKPPKGIASYFASLWDNPLLTREQEQQLFRKLNYLRYKLFHCRQALVAVCEEGPGELSLLGIWCRRLRGLCHEYANLECAASEVHQGITQANLRLVVNIAKRYVDRCEGFYEAISDGNVSLMKAVDQFDFFRGNKFVTYAQWAIKRNFDRGNRSDRNWRKFRSGDCGFLDDAIDPRPCEEDPDEKSVQDKEALVRRLLKRLDEREGKILTVRFGIGGAKEKTLVQLGRELGITKERVRQIETRGKEKLRRMCARERIEL